MDFKTLLPAKTFVVPIAAWLIYFFKTPELSNIYTILLAIGLGGCVMSAVHHAEVIAHRVGEPYGTLVLALAITIIEVSLIVSLMLAGGPDTSTLARDTVFAAIMIILTGIIGICLLVGGLKYKEQAFGEFGVSAALVALSAIAILTLVLPNYTTTIAGPVYSISQFIFISVVTLVIYGAFVFIQTGRHRDYFLPEIGDGSVEEHAKPPSLATTFLSLGLLLICLVAVVLIAKTLAPTIEKTVVEYGAPKSIVGILVAFVILLPEGIAAYKAARKNRLQTSLNLALGSALASIGLTIPAVAIVSVTTDLTVTLGIDTRSIVLLILSLLTIVISFSSGRTNVLQGVVLLVIFAVYLFTSLVP